MPHVHTVQAKELELQVARARRELAANGIDPWEHSRPATRGECPKERPCPFVGCRHHLAFDVMSVGGLRTARPVPLDACWDLPVSCSLDVADGLVRVDGVDADCDCDDTGGDGWITLEAVGDLLGVTRERVRQIEMNAVEKLRLGLSKMGCEVGPRDPRVADREVWRTNGRRKCSPGHRDRVPELCLCGCGTPLPSRRSGSAGRPLFWATTACYDRGEGGWPRSLARAKAKDGVCPVCGGRPGAGHIYCSGCYRRRR